MTKMNRFRLIATLWVLLPGLAGAAGAQGPSEPAETGAKKPPQTAGRRGDKITSEQADAILTELRAIRQLLESQEQRLAASQAPRSAAAPARASLSLAGAKEWYSQGKEDAPVTIVEFTDYQCPYCRRFAQGTFADLKKHYIDTGKLRFLTRDLPLAIHSNALRAAEAARCAGDQGKFWELREALFAGASDLSRDAILKDAQSLSLDVGSFTTCLDTEKHKGEVQADLAESARLRITGTPAFIVGKAAKEVLDGVQIRGALPFAAFDAAIKQALEAAP